MDVREFVAVPEGPLADGLDTVSDGDGLEGVAPEERGWVDGLDAVSDDDGLERRAPLEGSVETIVVRRIVIGVGRIACTGFYDFDGIRNDDGLKGGAVGERPVADGPDQFADVDALEVVAIAEGVAADGIDTLRQGDGNEVFPVPEEAVLDGADRGEVLELVEGCVAAVVAEDARKGGDGVGLGVGEFAVGVGVEVGHQFRLEVLVHEGDVPFRDILLEIQVSVGCGQDAEDAPLDGQFLADGHDGGFGLGGKAHPESVVGRAGQHDDVIGFPRLEGPAAGGVDLNDVGRFLDRAHIGEPVLVHADLHLAGQGFPVGSGNPNRADAFALDGEADAAAEVVEIQIQTIRLGHGDKQFVIEGTRHGCLGGGQGHGDGRPVASVVFVVWIDRPERVGIVVVEIRQGTVEFYFSIRFGIGGHKWGGAGVPVEQVDGLIGIPFDGTVLLERSTCLVSVGITSFESQFDLPVIRGGDDCVVFRLAGNSQGRQQQEISFFHDRPND